MSFPNSFARQPRAGIVGEMVAALLVIAVFDFVTGYKIRLASLYVGPRQGKARNILGFLAAPEQSISLRVLDDGVGISEPYSEGMGLTVKRRNSAGTTVSCTARTDSQDNEIAAE